jgi:hypothetical protein
MPGIIVEGRPRTPVPTFPSQGTRRIQTWASRLSEKTYFSHLQIPLRNIYSALSIRTSPGGKTGTIVPVTSPVVPLFPQCREKVRNKTRKMGNGAGTVRSSPAGTGEGAHRRIAASVGPGPCIPAREHCPVWGFRHAPGIFFQSCPKPPNDCPARSEILS